MNLLVKKRFLRNCGLVLVSSMLCWAATEIALQNTAYVALTLPFYHKFPPGYFRKDARLGIDHSPSQPAAVFEFRGPSHKVWTNSLGCFDYERQIEEGYILAIGDSMTWGYAPLEQKWTSILEKDSGVQIAKCGFVGTGPRYQIHKAEDVIRQIGMRPSSIIVLYTYQNDFNDDIVFPADTLLDGERVSNFKSLDVSTGRIERRTLNELRQSKIAQYKDGRRLSYFLRTTFVTAALAWHAKSQISNAWNQWRGEQAPEVKPPFTHIYQFNLLETRSEDYPWIERAFQEHIATLSEFKSVAQSFDARFILLSNGSCKAEMCRRLRQFFLTELPYYFDVGDYVLQKADGRATTYRFDGHWNELGNRLAAEGIRRYLSEAGII